MFGQFGVYCGEEFFGQCVYEVWLGVVCILVVVDGGDLFVWWGVVGVYWQEYVVGQCDFFELVEQCVGGGFSVGQ